MFMYCKFANGSQLEVSMENMCIQLCCDSSTNGMSLRDL